MNPCSALAYSRCSDSGPTVIPIDSSRRHGVLPSQIEGRTFRVQMKPERSESTVSPGEGSSIGSRRYASSRKERELSRCSLVAIPVQRRVNGWFHAGINRGRATKISTSLGRDGLGKVARTTAAVHCFSLGRKPKTLLRAFVRFDLTFAFSLTHQSRPDGISINLYLWCIYERKEDSGADRPWEVLMISVLCVPAGLPAWRSRIGTASPRQPDEKSAIWGICVRKT